jgi:hypothetical protein
MIALYVIKNMSIAKIGQGTGVSDEAFMILWLDDSKAGQVSGLARYREEFNEVV